MTDNIPDLIAEAREWASGSPLGKITAREVDKGILFARRLADALEAEHKQAEGLLVDLDARFEHSDHTAAKYYRRMREAEALAQKANLSIIDLVRMGNERADERDRYRAAIVQLREWVEENKPIVCSYGSPSDQDDAVTILSILTRALNENGETDAP